MTDINIGIAADVILVSVALITVIKYTVKGFVATVLGFASFIASFMLALHFYGRIEAPLLGLLEQSPVPAADKTSAVVAFVACLAFFLIVFGIVTRILKGAVSHIPIVGTLDRFLGLLIGVADAAVTLQIVSIVITLGITICADKMGISADPFLKSNVIRFFYEHNFLKETLGLAIY